MKQLNPIITLLSWPQWLALDVVLALLCLLAYLVWRQRFAKGGGKPAAPLAVPAQPAMSSNRLLEVWRRFVGAIPWRMRPDALGIPLFLVIGDAGSGKTGIIDRYANWQGQHYRFHPSVTDDPLLQIYLGAKALALEFSPSLLYDTSPAVYRAFGKLWRHLPQSPLAVVVIDAATLLEPQPDRLRQSGQALFGKLNVFDELEGKPLPLVLALSHMEKVQGFVEFCVFLEQAGIPLQIEFPEGDGANRLASCLEGFQGHLRRALVTRPAQDYLNIVAFLGEAPRLLGVLGEFLRQAGLEQGAAPSPVVRLCLLSEQIHSFGCHPFSQPPGMVEKPPITLNVHAKAALALLVAGLVYLVGSYCYEQVVLTGINKKIDIISIVPLQEYAEKISPMFLDFSLNLNKDPLLTFMPNYFKELGSYLDLRMIRNIRKYYLFPHLKAIQFDPQAYFKTIDTLALLYATSTNELGKILLRKLKTNPREEMVSNIVLIEDYIAHNSHTEELQTFLSSVTYSEPRNLFDNPTSWLLYFHNLQFLLNRHYISALELEAVKRKAGELYNIVNQIIYYPEQDELIQWLTKNTRFRRSLQIDYTQISQLRQDGIRKLLDFVRNINLENTNACVSTMPIIQCMNQVQLMATAKNDEKPVLLKFTFQGEYFAFDGGQWDDLLQRSRIVLMLRNIIYSHRNNDGLAFFDSPSLYPDVEMNPTNNGEAQFAGRGRIDGRLTADAFDQQVKPTVLALADSIAKLPIEADEKKRFSDFVLNNLNTYSDRYVSAYLNYFRQFQVRIDSRWALDYVLDQLQQPNSALLQTLLQIKNNTALNLPDKPSFKPFAQKLSAFRFVQRLMQEQNGAYPEFQKYQAIMLQMQNDLDSREPYMPKKSDDAAGLKAALTPMGRVAWGMLLNEEGSYSRLVKGWLQNAGIVDYWQQPFLAPVQKVAELGTAEIKQNIDGVWSDIWNSNVLPLLVKFPLMPDAGRDKELAVDDLIKVFHPKQGVFWATFQQYLAPLCSFGNGVWVKREELTDSLALPSDSLARLNSAQRLTATLWDGQGNPKPLQISVKPELLPAFDRKQIPDAPLVSLAYLRSGGFSVLGFNQQAAWQKLTMEWWTAQPAAVGMEFRKDADPTRVYSDTVVADSPWNLFRLLQQGQMVENSRYRWMLAHPDFPQQKLNLEFSFRTDPWKVFTDLAGGWP